MAHTKRPVEFRQGVFLSVWFPHPPVITAKAGIQELSKSTLRTYWIPAFAGKTGMGSSPVPKLQLGNAYPGALLRKTSEFNWKCYDLSSDLGEDSLRGDSRLRGNDRKGEFWLIQVITS